MTTYVALLRGINLGAKRKILMADLCQLFINLGFMNVKTYIHTGNVLFNSDKITNKVEIENILEEAILTHYGFDVTVIIRTHQELYDIVFSNPFKEQGDIDRLHMTLLKETPGELEKTRIKYEDYNPDTFEIINNNIYIYCSRQYMDTKLGNNFFEKHLAVKATTRNFKVISKLVDLSN